MHWGAACDWQAIAADQAGVVGRAQLIAGGWSAAQARQGVDSGRWRALHPGVYLTFVGPAPELSRLWAAVLHAGPGAALTGRTALYLHGVLDALPSTLEVAIPHSRHVLARPGLSMVRVRQLARLVQPAGSPPRLRVECAVLDVAGRAERVDDVVDVVLRAIQRRRTTASRLADALAATSRHRWRCLIGEVLQDAVAGVRSPLERRYLHSVARAHGLPEGTCNAEVIERDGHGRSTGRRYRDVRYPRWRLVVELDGLEAHPDHEAWRDRRRDNRTVIAGDVSLRYGWRDVVCVPCEVAAEVARALRARGWTGQPTGCGPGCLLGRNTETG